MSADFPPFFPTSAKHLLTDLPTNSRLSKIHIAYDPNLQLYGTYG